MQTLFYNTKRVVIEERVLLLKMLIDDNKVLIELHELFCLGN